MSRGDTPGEFEQVVLLTLAAFCEPTASREVYEEIVSATGRDVSVAGVHITLGRLVEKGWAEELETPPRGEDGGRTRNFYRLSPEGAAVLADLRSRFDRLWAGAVDHPLVVRERGSEE